jgi:gluconokinase
LAPLDQGVTSVKQQVELTAHRPVAVMGVSGCGKTTVGRLLAGRLGVPFAEADSFHPAANIAKMAEGIPLADADRAPWLAAIAAHIHLESRLVVSCSALKRAYRDVLRQAAPRIWFLHLVIDRETAIARVTGRTGHFMPASLVDSQFADLEPLRGEAGLTVDGTRPPGDIIATALQALADGG